MERASKERFIRVLLKRGLLAAVLRESLKVFVLAVWDWIKFDQRVSWRRRVAWFGCRV